MTSRNYVAIDPGKSGGFAWQIGDEIGCAAMPESDPVIADFIRTLIARGNGDITFAIEKLPLFTGRNIPGSCMAVLHANAGVCIGAALALCARVVMVEPHEWQKFFRLGTKKDCGDNTTKWKNKLKAEAIRRFPSRNITLKTADALLILEEARLTGR